jgi:hypothetical protein
VPYESQGLFGGSGRKKEECSNAVPRRLCSLSTSFAPVIAASVIAAKGETKDAAGHHRMRIDGIAISKKEAD